MHHQTQIQAWHEFKDSAKHLKQRDAVLKAFEILVVASDADVVKLTGIGIRQVSTRRGELGDLVIKCGTKIDPVTNFDVSTYKINPEPELFQVKKISNAQKLKEIEQICKDALYSSQDSLAGKILETIAKK